MKFQCKPGEFPRGGISHSPRTPRGAKQNHSLRGIPREQIAGLSHRITSLAISWLTFLRQLASQI